MSRYKRLKLRNQKPKDPTAALLFERLALLEVENAADLAFRIANAKYPPIENTDRIESAFDFFDWLETIDVPVAIGGDWVADLYLGRVLGPHASIVAIVDGEHLDEVRNAVQSSRFDWVEVIEAVDPTEVGERKLQIVRNNRHAAARPMNASIWFERTLRLVKQDPERISPKMLADLRAIGPLLSMATLKQAPGSTAARAEP